MLGFAIVKDDGRSIAVWLVSALGDVAINSNAYVSPTADADLGQTLERLIHDRVILGDTAVLESLDIQTSKALGLDDVQAWDKDRQTLQDQMNSFVERTNKNWKIPFEETALVPPPTVDHDEARHAALAWADYLRQVWTKWLSTEAERLRRAWENKNRVPEELSSTDHRGVPLAEVSAHRWAGTSADLSLPGRTHTEDDRR